jgi:hypothetical protein
MANGALVIYSLSVSRCRALGFNPHSCGVLDQDPVTFQVLAPDDPTVFEVIRGHWTEGRRMDPASAPPEFTV